jgi:hypothetical protein
LNVIRALKDPPAAEENRSQELQPDLMMMNLSAFFPGQELIVRGTGHG